MTALAASARPERRLDLTSGALGFAVAIAPVLLGVVAASADGLRLAIAAGATLLLLGLGLASPRALLFALFVWVFALGTTRRVVSLDTPLDGLDPLLAVLPIGVFALLLTAGGAFRDRSVLSNAVLVFGGLIALSALNPLQGSASAGAVGAVLLLTPLAGFWVGRSLDDAAFAKLWGLVAALGLVAAIYGLVQIMRGFPIWDEQWLHDFGYEALNVGAATRPFSSFASSAEHVLFLAVATVIWLAYGIRRAAAPIAVAAVGLILVSLFLASTRGAVFAVALAVGAIVFARLRVPLLPAAAGAALVVLLLPAVTERLAPDRYGSGEVGHLVAHQVEGLADPLSSETSTLGLHLDLALDGFAAAMREPLGVGPGPVTNAARLGGGGQSTELDPSNVAVALGLPGLLAYMAVLGLGLTRAYRLARSRRDALSLVALGVLVATLFQWLNGGLYLVAILPWLALGWLDRPEGSRGKAA